MPLTALHLQLLFDSMILTFNAECVPQAFRAAAAASKISAVGDFKYPRPEGPGQQWQQHRGSVSHSFRRQGLLLLITVLKCRQ